jgi:hypothetical protein
MIRNILNPLYPLYPLYPLFKKVIQSEEQNKVMEIVVKTFAKLFLKVCLATPFLKVLKK